MKFIRDNTSISDDFQMWEFELSHIANKYNIDNYIPEHLKGNLYRFVNRTLQPLRDLIDLPITVTSGYRSEILNSHPKINGSKESRHLTCEASDIVSHYSPKELMLVLKHSRIPFTKAINEANRWLHLSYDGSNTRLCFETELKRDDKGKIIYTRV